LGINRLRIIVTQEAEAGVDLFFQQNAIGFRKTGQHLDQQRQQIRPFRNAPGLTHGPPHPAATLPLHAIRKRGHALHYAIDSIGYLSYQFGHCYLGVKFTLSLGRRNDRATSLRPFVKQPSWLWGQRASCPSSARFHISTSHSNTNPESLSNLPRRDSC